MAVTLGVEVDGGTEVEGVEVATIVVDVEVLVVVEVGEFVVVEVELIIGN